MRVRKNFIQVQKTHENTGQYAFNISYPSFLTLTETNCLPDVPPEFRDPEIGCEEIEGSVQHALSNCYSNLSSHYVGRGEALVELGYSQAAFAAHEAGLYYAKKALETANFPELKNMCHHNTAACYFNLGNLKNADPDKHQEAVSLYKNGLAELAQISDQEKDDENLELLARIQKAINPAWQADISAPVEAEEKELEFSSSSSEDSSCSPPQSPSWLSSPSRLSVSYSPFSPPSPRFLSPLCSRSGSWSLFTQINETTIERTHKIILTLQEDEYLEPEKNTEKLVAYQQNTLSEIYANLDFHFFERSMELINKGYPKAAAAALEAAIFYAQKSLEKAPDPTSKDVCRHNLATDYFELGKLKNSNSATQHHARSLYEKGIQQLESIPVDKRDATSTGLMTKLQEALDTAPKNGPRVLSITTCQDDDEENADIRFLPASRRPASPYLYKFTAGGSASPSVTPSVEDDQHYTAINQP